MIKEADFQKMTFKTHGVVEPESPKPAMKVPQGWSPTHTDIRSQLSDLVLEKTDEYREKHKVKMSNYNVIEHCCRIPTDTMKKALNGKYRITRNFLAKFTVGLQIDLAQANEIFRKHSGQLDLTNDFDFIVYHALLSKDGVDDFMEEVDRYLGINLDKDKM